MQWLPIIRSNSEFESSNYNKNFIKHLKFKITEKELDEIR